MGLLDMIFRPNKQAVREARETFRTLTTYRPAFTTWSGSLYESELVRAAIDARARNISKLKIEISGAAKPALQTKMRQGPNPWQTYSQFMYRISTILDMQNNCFVVPILDRYLEPTGYFPVLPSRCELVDYKGEPWVRYTFANGQNAAIELSKVALLTKFQYKDDFFGSTNRALDDTLDLIHIQKQGIKEAVKNSATYRFMAKLTNFSKGQDLARERKEFSEQNFGAEAEAKNGMLLFPNTYTDIKQIENKAYTVDAEQLKTIQTNVFNYFGVNEDVIQNKAFGDAWSAFYEGAIEPFAIQFSEAMTKAMFTERERASGSYLMATANRLQYLSNADKLNVSAQMADRGIMTINEIRDIWNLAPVEGGDVRPVRGEYQMLGDNSNAD